MFDAFVARMRGHAPVVTAAVCRGCGQGCSVFRLTR